MVVWHSPLSRMCSGTTGLDHPSCETTEVGCGRVTLLCLTRYRNISVHWLKLSHGTARGADRTRCVNRTEIRLSYGIKAQGSAQTEPKGHASGQAVEASRKCVGTYPE